LLPDPGALAILLAAVASGKLLLGLFTVLVFSLGFASSSWSSAWSRCEWDECCSPGSRAGGSPGGQIGLALVIVGIGLVLTTNAARLVATLR